MNKTDEEKMAALRANSWEVVLHLYGLVVFAEGVIARGPDNAEAVYSNCPGFKKSSLGELVRDARGLLEGILL